MRLDLLVSRPELQANLDAKRSDIDHWARLSLELGDRATDFVIGAIQVVPMPNTPTDGGIHATVGGVYTQNQKGNDRDLKVWGRSLADKLRGWSGKNPEVTTVIDGLPPEVQTHHHECTI